ncbi:MAG: Hpt domain-containing protein [Pseudomonadota bacterium]
MVETATIDTEALGKLLKMIGGDTEDLQELIDDYLTEAPQIAAQMTAAAQTGDSEALRRHAHTLKGNAKDFGATDLAERAAALESGLKAGPVDDAATQVAAIVQAEEKSRAALAALDVEALFA